MTEKNETGGSSPERNDAKTSPPATNKTAKISVDQALAELEVVRKTVQEKDALIQDLTNQLKQANEVLEGAAKAKDIKEIMLRSSYKMDDLVGKSLEELKSIKLALEQAVPPKVNSVNYGVFAADISDREKGLTVGDLSIVTAAKRARGAH